mgnify:FL=1
MPSIKILGLYASITYKQINKCLYVYVSCIILLLHKGIQVEAPLK